MLRTKKIVFLVLCFGLLITPFLSLATHLKGGEISIKRISTVSLTFEFTLITYTENNRANADQVDANFCFGDGSGIYKAPRTKDPEDLGNGTLKNTYKITYTYPAPSAIYKVSVAIPNRNEGVDNINNSVSVPFYVETIFSTNSGLGLNSTPIFLNPAVDLTARVGQIYIHNPGAIDLEGDSLAYRLSVSKYGDQDKCGDANRGQIAPGFVQPNEYSKTPSSFSINPTSGDLIWDVPQEVGKFNCAFIVEEWRNGIKISETVRDMQIEVMNDNNNRPRLEGPKDICVTAGAYIQKTITAQDYPTPADQGNRIDKINLTSTSNIYPNGDSPYISPEFASFENQYNQTGPLTANFSWQTNCNHIRRYPYDVLFKVVDNPPISIESGLVDSKIWHIRVIAPPPTGLKAKVLGPKAGVELTWDDYNCNLTNAKIVIFRKKGACEDITLDSCSTGKVPEGYTKIATVNLSDKKFTDNSGLLKLENYVYVAYIQFTNSFAVLNFSPLSNTACALIPSIASIMTNVSVTKTDTQNGEIFVRWSIPRNFDQNTIQGPYYYELTRAIGASSTNFQAISGKIPADLSGLTNDTSFVDNNLNTFNSLIYYKVNFYSTLNNSPILQDNSKEARNVYLIGSTKKTEIKLKWFTDTPWSNEFQEHRVYRETTHGSGIFNQIANVSVGNSSTFQFVDLGQDLFPEDGDSSITLQPDSTYCYFVETKGEYGEGYPKFTLINASQIVCFKTVEGGTGGNDGGIDDGTSNLNLCAPQLINVGTDCENINQNENCDPFNFTNRLTWELQKANTCDTNIVAYRVYYSPKSDSTFTLINSTLAESFNHLKTDEIKGCYYIQALGKNGKLSEISNKICVENCPSFDLPNVFSPNNDGKNDRFLPLNCARFVENVKAKIVDRYGQTVYSYDGNLQGFGWDGTNLLGNPLPPSTYFYQVEVKFKGGGAENQNKSLKGWLELIY